MLTHSPEGVPVLEPKRMVRRRFAMTLGIAAIVGLIALLLAPSGANDRILGGGSTAAQPLIERTAVKFQNARSGDTDWTSGSGGIEYEPVGSLGGVMRLEDPEFDFAVTDYPLSAEALAQRGAVQFPIVISSISVIYRLEQVQAPLRFSPATLAGIFMGRIGSWSDPAIAADNPGIDLPATPISVVHRSDGSGSTLNWSGYIARGDTRWDNEMGTGTTLQWPAGAGVRGGGEMAKAVAATEGAIGYLETGRATRTDLSIGLLRNRAGQFIAPTEASIAEAGRAIGLADGQDPRRADPGAAGAYPIVAASYAILKKDNASSGDNPRTLRFLSFLLEQPQAARELGYMALSPDQVARVRQVWSRELGFNAATGAVAASP